MQAICFSQLGRKRCEKLDGPKILRLSSRVVKGLWCRLTPSFWRGSQKRSYSHSWSISTECNLTLTTSTSISTGHLTEPISKASIQGGDGTSPLSYLQSDRAAEDRDRVEAGGLSRKASKARFLLHGHDYAAATSRHFLTHRDSRGISSTSRNIGPYWPMLLTFLFLTGLVARKPTLSAVGSHMSYVAPRRGPSARRALWMKVESSCRMRMCRPGRGSKRAFSTMPQDRNAGYGTRQRMGGVAPVTFPISATADSMSLEGLMIRLKMCSGRGQQGV
ncbi:uncharacterized protein BDZ83DRAFT_360349 [Colletotrichum acutatum]|uniref:Uncharacterized protein n=1 Tax=Glomerella acutata TaxID=27357 RepID=A0AAD8UMT4_GLOAC|nr:uncharacterized protein BDZ83DRAFT_360349 [Colletotrichum acutatum]KAK1724196.1 hypothetical protein BDZ83DRAFT_360349 [Colletotrichum acutatum]